MVGFERLADGELVVTDILAAFSEESPRLPSSLVNLSEGCSASFAQAVAGAGLEAEDLWVMAQSDSLDVAVCPLVYGLGVAPRDCWV